MTAVTGNDIWAKVGDSTGTICDDATVVTNLRLALDVAAVHAQPAGVGIYAASLARALARMAPEKVSLIGVRDEARALDATRSKVRAFRFRAPRVGADRAPSYSMWLQLSADRDARRAGANLVHYTNAAAPIFSSRPFVLTVHDLSIIRLPRFHPMLRVGTIPLMLAGIARARTIIVPSNWVQTELRQVLRVSARRIVVIEHAASDLTPRPTESAEVLARFGLTPRGYLLSVATIEPRKNLSRLIAAFELLAADDPGLRLVLAGSPGWRRGSIERRIYASRYADRILLAGYVSDVDAAALTRSCAAFCYVSTYEGYGLPVIEALALGAPVVTSRTTAMPQAAGGAAVLVDPFDVADIARGIRTAIARRTELSSLGPARAARRNWDDVAVDHMAVYSWAVRRA